MDLITLISDGSMRAAAAIATDKGLQVDATRVCRALRDAITEGWQQAANEAREACELSEAHGRYSLNLSCNLFAATALRACGYLEEK